MAKLGEVTPVKEEAVRAGEVVGPEVKAEVVGEEAAPQVPVTPEIEAKKTDIERRRQKELNEIPLIPQAFDNIGNKQPIMVQREKEAEALAKNINAKYDAELAVLGVGEEVAPQVPPTPRIPKERAAQLREQIKVEEVGEEAAPQVPVTPEKEIPEEYEGYYKEGLPTYNIEDFKKNPKILESDEAYFTIGYPNSFIGLSTDRSLISKENNIPPESIKVGDIVSVSGKKYAVADIAELKKGKESIKLLRINENGDFIRLRDLPKKEAAAELPTEEIEEEEITEEAPTEEELKVSKEINIKEDEIPRVKKASTKRSRKSKDIAKTIESEAADVESSGDAERAADVVTTIERAEKAILEDKPVDTRFEDKYGMSEIELAREYDSRQGKVDIFTIYESLSGKKIERGTEAEFISSFLNALNSEGFKLKKPLELDFGVVVNTTSFPAKKLKKEGFDSLEKIVSKDDIRPIFQSVFFDKGNLVATDAHTLVVIKQKESDSDIIKNAKEKLIKSYSKTVGEKEATRFANEKYAPLEKSGLEGKLINQKTGEITDGKFPDYQAIIPQDFPLTQSLPIQDIINLTNGAIEGLKSASKTRMAIMFNVTGDTEVKLGINPSFLLKTLQALQANGAKSIKMGFGGPTKAITIRADNGDMGLVMPLMINEDDLKINITDAKPLTVKKAKVGDAVRKLAEKAREGKINKPGTARASTGFDVVWDAALEVVATSLEGGASVADAIEAGLKYVKSTGWYKKVKNKEEFDQQFKDVLNQEYAVQVEAAGEVPVQPEAGVSEEVEAGVPPTEPPKPPQEGEAEGAAEKKSVELSLKGINDVANEFSIEQVEGRPRKTDIELREEAKAQIDKWVSEGSYEKNIDSLIKRAEESEVLTDKDRVILEQHLANLRQEFKDGIDNGTITPDSPEFDNRLNGLKKLINAAAKTRSAAGAALRIPTGGSVAHPLENYDTALVAKMEANGVDVLTPEQKMEVEESVKLYKEKLDDANAKIKDLEDKMSQMMAEEEVGIAKKKRQIKSKEARIQERKDAVAAAREALRRLRSGQEGLSSVPLPYVREFVAIAPHVKKVMESYIGEGIDNLTVLIDKIYEDFKDVVPEITRKDVRDIIGGDYSPKKETLNQQKRIIGELKQGAKLLGEYEKLLAGEEPRLPRQKVQKNRKIKEIRDKINEIRKRNREADVDYTDLKKINDTKNRALQRAEEYKKKIENKDFAPSEESVSIFNDLRLQRKFPKEYAEMLDAVKEKEDAKHEFDIALLKDEQQKETGLQKTGRFLKNIVGTTKAIKSGIDDSGVLIQNFAAVLAYPASGLKTFLNHWQDFASEKKFNRWHTQLKNNKPVWDLIERSGLSVTEPSALKEAQKEEIFSNNLLDRTFKVAGKSYNIGKYTTKPFERLFVSMGNGLRVDVFLKLAQKLYEEGKTFETHPEEFKSIASMLNSMTGRGKLAPAVQRASDIIGGGIWSPQLMASRLNLLGISDLASPLTGRKGYYKGLSPEVRKMQVRNMAQMIGTGLGVMALASLAGGESDFDPESPTFGTVQVGNKRIPVFSNFSKYVKAIVQFATGKQRIEGERIGKNRMQTVTKFFRSGVPPATGAVIDILSGRDYAGQPVTTEGIIRSTIAPMSLEGIAKEVKRDGALGAVTGLGQFFGLNISDERDYVKREDQPFEVKDPVTFKKRETTPRELEVFKKRRDQIYKELTRDYEKGGETIYITQNGDIKLSIPSSVSDDELSLWKEVSYRQLDKEKAKELYKLLMSKAKKDAKSELELEEVGEKDNE
jgi:hypothetical protein